MMSLRSPHVVLFIGVCSKPPNMCIISEFLGGGSLYNYIHTELVKLPFDKIKQYAIDIATGMNYLHLSTPPIIHRDLKSLNILLDEYHNHCKITDFGMSKIRYEEEQVNTVGSIGTPIWMAPELMRGEKYNEKIDVYSFGIMLYEMIANELPFKELNQMQLLMEVAVKNQRPNLTVTCSAPLHTLMTNCWDENPKNRPSFQQIIEILRALPDQ